MAKGKKQKKKKKSKLFGVSSQGSGSADVAGSGDLRSIPLHVEHWLKGEEEAASALQSMGRDAAFTVIKIAKEQGNKELEEFGRGLVPIKPESETNMAQLRAQSVMELVAKVISGSPVAYEANVEVAGGAVAFFDPHLVADDLAKGGRPRNDPARVGVGDLVWFGLPSPDPTAIAFSSDVPPEDQETLRLPLVVQSGVLFVGPPQASDGPRLGSVRLDPFSTSLHDRRDEGQFLRVKPGNYALLAYADREGTVRVHLNSVKKPDRPGELNAHSLLLPTQVDADHREE